MNGVETIREFFASLGVDLDARSFAAAEKALGAVHTGLLGIVGFAAAAGAALGEMVRETTKAAADTDDLSHSIGTTTDALQELGYAAKMSGSDADGLRVGITILSRQIYAASKGSKEAAEGFGAMGVAVTDVTGAARPAEDVLGDIADHIAAMPDGTEKTALALKAFGRSGASLVPLLNEGSKGISTLRQEARDLGVVMDKNTIAAGARLDDSLDRLRFAAVGLRNAIAGPLLQGLQPVVEGFARWIAQNRQIIALRIHQTLSTVGKVFRAIWVVLGPIVKLFGALISNTKVLTAGLIVLGIAVLAMAGEFVVAGAAAVASAIAAGAAWLLAAAPIAILVALLAAVVLVAQSIWVAMNGGKSIVADLWAEWSKFYYSWLYNTDGDGWLMIAFKTLLALLTDSGHMWDSIVEVIKEDIRWLEEKAEWIIGKVKEGLELIGIKLESKTAGNRSDEGTSDLQLMTRAQQLQALAKMTDKELQTGRIGAGNVATSTLFEEEIARRASRPAAAPPPGFFGAALQPAQAQANSIRSFTLQPSITIVAQPGQDPHAIGEHVRGIMDDWFNVKLRQADNGT